MSELVLYLVAGLVTGSLYGLAGMGLTLTYTTSGIFNFANGTVSAVGAYAFYSLHEQAGLAWPLAAVITLLVVAPLLGLALERLAAGLAPARPAMKVVGTVGLLLFLVGLAQRVYGSQQRAFPPFLPQGSASVLGVRVSAEQAIDGVLAATVAVGLAVLLKRTQTGRAMRAVVADPDLLSLTGQSPLRVRRTAWILGTQLACLSGVLIATTLGLDAILLTLLVVSAFGAAAVGRFRSLPLTFAGGLLVGVVESELRNLTAGSLALSSLPSATPFLVLLAVLVLTPKGRLLEIPTRSRSGTSTAAGIGTVGVPQLVLSTLGVLGLLVVPALVGPRLVAWTQLLAYVPVFLSLGLLVWTSGQVSLTHAAFVALGASSMSHLALGVHLPWLLALVLGGLAVVPLGVLVAIPAVRVSGLYLALATFGFGVIVQVLVYTRGFAFGLLGQVQVPRPAGFGSDRGYYYLVLAVAAGASVLTAVVHRSRVGRLLRALADSPTALVTYGAEVNRLRVLVFGLSAFLAGVSGGLLGGVTQSISTVGLDPFASLTWLAVLALVGSRSGVVQAVLAAAALTLTPSYLPSLDPALFTLLFGGSALLAALLDDRRTWSPGVRTRDRLRVPGPAAARREAAV